MVSKEMEFSVFQETELYKLGPPESFHYLNQSSCIEIPGRESNADGYLQTKRAMSIVGVSPEEQVNWADGRYLLSLTSILYKRMPPFAGEYT